MSSLVFDIEADNLLDYATRIWCIVTKDIETQEVKQYHGSSIQAGVESLLGAGLIIGHNIIGYDIPLLEKLGHAGYFFLHQKAYDTFVMSCLLNPDRGGHGLDAWGKRLRRYKPAHEDWSVFSEEMLHRCTEDVEINYLVYLELMKEKENVL